MGTSISLGVAGGAPNGATRTRNARSLNAVTAIENAPKWVTKSEEAVFVAARTRPLDKIAAPAPLPSSARRVIDQRRGVFFPFTQPPVRFVAAQRRRQPQSYIVFDNCDIPRGKIDRFATLAPMQAC